MGFFDTLYKLHPLESAADLAIVIGGTALISGIGGRYFFLVPTWEAPGCDPSTATSQPCAYFSVHVPGVTDPHYTLLNTAACWRMLGCTMFGQSVGTMNVMGTDKDGKPTIFSGIAPYSSGEKDATIVEMYGVSSGATWGPFGQYAGFIFLGMFVGGIIARGVTALY